MSRSIRPRFLWQKRQIESVSHKGGSESHLQLLATKEDYSEYEWRELIMRIGLLKPLIWEVYKDHLCWRCSLTDTMQDYNLISANCRLLKPVCPATPEVSVRANAYKVRKKQKQSSILKAVDVLLWSLWWRQLAFLNRSSRQLSIYQS